LPEAALRETGRDWSGRRGRGLRLLLPGADRRRRLILSDAAGLPWGLRLAEPALLELLRLGR
jgi:hypothetical protein